jgi:hypothetical protein
VQTVPLMSDMAYRSFDLGKTKSSPKWHIIKYGRTSWCNHEVVGEIRVDVQFGDFPRALNLRRELCGTCQNALTFADAREMPKRFPGIAAAEKGH